MSSAQKGSHRERELVNRFRDAGWGALRLPSSGSATDRELPDVLAGRLDSLRFYVNGDGIDLIETKSELLAVELKSGADTTLYVEAHEVENLRTFAQTWGARPLLGARFTSQASGTATWLVSPDEARGPTASGLYGLPVSDIDERADAVVSDESVEVVCRD